VFAVSEGAEVSFITVAGGATTAIGKGDNLTVSIAPATVALEFDTAYKGAPSGYKLLKKEITADDAAKVWTYGGAAMHNILTGGKHYATYIVEAAVTSDTASAIAKTETAYSVSANIDGVGEVNISDSQIAFDLANGYTGYNAASTLTIAIRLAADVNGDGQVTSDDAQAIIYAIHHSGVLQ
jgi:hypothetical protein